MSDWMLTYRGPSDVFEDPRSGLVWQRNKAWKVDEETKVRLVDPPKPPEDPDERRFWYPPVPGPYDARWEAEEIKPLGRRRQPEPEPEPEPEASSP